MTLAFSNPANQVAIPAMGGILAVVAAMNAHTASENVQLYGCSALLNMALDAANKVAIAAKGGILAVVAALNAHPASENVQHYGCRALVSLALSNPANQVAIAAIAIPL
jgi:hypothetical protein